MKKVLVACGTGMSTSTMIAQKLQDYLASEHLSGDFTMLFKRNPTKQPRC